MLRLQTLLETSGTAGSAASVDFSTCRRILVVKLDHLGDWVLCTPFLESLRRNAPHAEIDALVLPQVADLACTCPHVDRVITLRSNRIEKIHISAERPMDALTFRRHYAGGDFDLAVVPRWDADFEGAARIACGSGARLVVGFSENCTSRKHALNRGDDRFYTHAVEDLKVMHEVEHNLDLLEAMNGRVMTRRVAVHPNNSDDQSARRWLAKHLGASPWPLIALALFASEPKRELPTGEFAALIRQITPSSRCRFVVLGGPDDRIRGAQLTALLTPRAALAAGQLGIREAAALIRHCNVLIGADSALAHIAAAVDTPVAVLSCHPANGSPNHANSPLRFAPWNVMNRSKVLVLQPASAIPPCSSSCEATEPHCIRGVDRKAVTALAAFVRNSLDHFVAGGRFDLGTGNSAAQIDRQHSPIGVSP